MGRRIRGQIRRRERRGLRARHTMKCWFRRCMRLIYSTAGVSPMASDDYEFGPGEESPFMRLVAPAGVRSGMAEPWPFEGQYTFGRSP